MKKYFSIYSIGWAIVLFEIILCTVFTLSVFLVNGTDAVGKDHLVLFSLIAITIVSIILMKSGKNFFNKAVLGMALIPLLFIGYQVMTTVVTPGHPQLQMNQPTLIGVVVF